MRGPLTGDPPWGGGIRVLVVDDEEALAQLTRDQLRRLGYRVEVAASGEEVRRLFEERGGAFEVLVTDESLDDVSGSELASGLREHHPGLAVVLVSGWSNLVAELRESRPWAVLAKPFAYGELARAILQARVAGGRRRASGTERRRTAPEAGGRGGGTRTRDT